MPAQFPGGLLVAGRRGQSQQPGALLADRQVPRQQRCHRLRQLSERVYQRHGDAEPRRAGADGLGGDRDQFPLGHVALGDDVALAHPASLRRQQQGVGDVIDTHHFGGDAAHVERQSPERREPNEHPLPRLPIGRTVRIRDIRHHGGQPAVRDVREHQVFGLAARLDVTPGLVRPVERRVLVDGFAVLADRNGADGAQEDESAKGGRCRHLEHVAETRDVGFEQWGGIAQLRSGVDDAVIDDVAVTHGGIDLRRVEDVAVAPLEGQAVDPPGRARPS
jgi:hypothetical protein